MACPFCTLDSEQLVSEDDLTVAVRDGYPVSPGHTLVIPRRHVSSWFGLDEVERVAVLHAVDRAKEQLESDLHPDGWNIGINVGAAAGQTVWHVHVHLIPRFEGDMDDPRGGVRHCVAGKGHYEAD